MSVLKIGVHVSPEAKIEFLEQQDVSGRLTIQARVSNIQDLVKVVLPQTQSICSLGFSSSSAKIESLLRNRHFKPVYLAEQKEVHFKPFFAGGTSWEKGNEISVVSSSSNAKLFKWVCRSNGTISYAFINTVKTWDPVNDNWTVTSYPTPTITALSEDANGFLVIGDEKGHLHISGLSPSPTGIADKIEEIIPVTSHHLVVKFSQQNAIIFDVESKARLEEIELKGEVSVLEDGSITYLNENTIVIQKYHPIDKKYQKTEYKFENIHQIRLISNMNIVVLHKDEKSLTLWNAETEVSTPFQNSTLWEKCLYNTIILLDNETLVIKGKFSPSFYSNKTFKHTPEPSPKGWGINDMILLSNGSVMYATDSRGSGIYVVQQDGTLHFSRPTDDRKIESLKELVDGSVAVKFSDSICILNPCFKEHENIDYQIDQLQLQLRYNPTNLNLYRQLAGLYEKKNEQPYQIYLSGLEAAVKCNTLYQARRFYEKARKIQPQNEEPIQNFLCYLKKLTYEKLKRKTSLDLYALTKNEEYIRPLKHRKCKKRLLIGEGNFTFTEALLSKHQDTHPKLSQSIIATELLAPVNQEVIDRVFFLQKQGVEILFDVDAKNIGRFFKGRRFERIHWNCPFGDKDPKSRETFQKVLPLFFQSCSSLQLIGDRIHVTLVQEEPTSSNGYWKIRQKENPIVEASVLAGYGLIRKRHFGTDRYTQYCHSKTRQEQSYSGGDEKREFVFEKVAEKVSKPTFLDKAMALKDPTKKEYLVKTDKKENPEPADFYFECSSDEESSDYYESD